MKGAVVFNFLIAVLVFSTFMMIHVCFIMFGGEKPSERVYERFSLYPVDMELVEYDHDTRLGVRYDIQTTGSVQSVCGVKCL